MLRKDFILCKTRKLLNEFMKPIISQTDRPRQKFLMQVISAILISSTLVVSEFARLIHDDCSDIFYRVKRLLNNLFSKEGDLTTAIGAYRQMAAKFIEPDTPIVIDLTDLAKPRAKKLKYLDLVRDASEDRLVPGYWCVEAYAHLKNKRVFPLALDVFSIEDPSVKSQNLQIYRTVKAVNEALCGCGVWIGDRGFDALNLYEMWFSLKCHFVIRQRGDRCVVASNGVRYIVADLVEHLRQRQIQTGHSGDIIFTKAFLPDNDRPLYLVAVWSQKYEEPLILLTTLVVENLEQARRIVWYYRQRWVCEEVTRFLKSKVGFERFCVRRYEAIQRLAILAMFAMGFLTWILLRSRQLMNGLFYFTSRFRKKSNFAYYRLLDGLQEFARLLQLRASKIEPLLLENG